MKLSVIIPARNEEAFIGACLQSIRTASESFPGQVEIVVAINRCTDRTEEIALDHGAIIVRNDAKNLAMIRNTAARAATGDILVTIDADSAMSPNMLSEIYRYLSSGKYIGGGVKIEPERWSVGIVVTGLFVIVPLLLKDWVSAGLFWCFKEDFDSIGGFNEELVSLEDMDFASRLKAYGKSRGKRFKTIWRAHIVTSCRKFDMFGDWYLLRNRKLLRGLLNGKTQSAANSFYYDVER